VHGRCDQPADFSRVLNSISADTQTDQLETRSGPFAKGRDPQLTERERHRQAPLTHLPTHRFGWDLVTLGASSRRAKFSHALIRKEASARRETSWCAIREVYLSATLPLYGPDT